MGDGGEQSCVGVRVIVCVKYGVWCGVVCGCAAISRRALTQSRGKLC